MRRHNHLRQREKKEISKPGFGKEEEGEVLVDDRSTIWGIPDPSGGRKAAAKFICA